MEGLYAVGEVAFTGPYGANRMASNSLLECLVFAAAAADHIRPQLGSIPPLPTLPDWDERVTDSDEEVVVSHNRGIRAVHGTMSGLSGEQTNVCNALSTGANCRCERSPVSITVLESAAIWWSCAPSSGGGAIIAARWPGASRGAALHPWTIPVERDRARAGARAGSANFAGANAPPHC